MQGAKSLLKILGWQEPLLCTLPEMYPCRAWQLAVALPPKLCKVMYNLITLRKVQVAQPN